MLKLSWKLSVVTLIAIPLIGSVSSFVGTKYKTVSEKVQNTLAEANCSAAEAISAIRTVRSFAAEKHEAERYSELLKNVLKFIKKEGILENIFHWTKAATELSILVLTLCYGAHLVFKG